MKAAPIVSHVSTFLLGLAVGAGSMRAFEPGPAEAAEIIDAAPRFTGTEHPPSYCETFPDRCLPGTRASCPPTETDPETGAVLVGCTPVAYVCCAPGQGCWAVHSASACEHWLYWSDCEAGESAIDPDSGEAIIICHD